MSYDLIMMCEVKLQEGDRLDEYSITGFTEEAYLRLNHAEGGIIVWIRKGVGLHAQVVDSQSNSERVWVRVESGAQRFAICQV